MYDSTHIEVLKSTAAAAILGMLEGEWHVVIHMFLPNSNTWARCLLSMGILLYTLQCSVLTCVPHVCLRLLSDNERILLGGEDGLFMLEIADDGVHRLGDKKVVQIEVAKEENTVIYLGGGPCMYVCTYVTFLDQVGQWLVLGQTSWLLIEIIIRLTINVMWNMQLAWWTSNGYWAMLPYAVVTHSTVGTYCSFYIKLHVHSQCCCHRPLVSVGMLLADSY